MSGMLIGGIDEKTFKAIATAVGSFLAKQQQGETNQLPEAAQVRAVVERVGGLSAENKQKFADACAH